MTAQYLFDTYAQESFDNSRDHGFWEDKDNQIVYMKWLSDRLGFNNMDKHVLESVE